MSEDTGTTGRASFGGERDWWCPSHPPGPVKAGVEKSLAVETIGKQREGRHHGLNFCSRAMRREVGVFGTLRGT